MQFHTDTETVERSEPEVPKLLLCRQCRQPITTPEHRIVVNNYHCHTFANPGGIVFDVGCFQRAPGCGHTGAPTDEFTWFPGYKWQIAVCGGCLLHMGWRFTSPAGEFHALILDNLVPSQDKKTAS
ncbi:MAG: cereblon family protein [Thermodesulfobacteriota bacterium]|nr:cereblon family protein [Thermodesulfobacteriota bacterium]